MATKTLTVAERDEQICAIKAKIAELKAELRELKQAPVCETPTAEETNNA